MISNVTDNLHKNLDAVLDRAVAQQRIVGGVLLVLHNGREVYARAAGLSDREANTPMHTETVFRLASLTKPIATVAALRLVETGKLALDAPITKYLPEFTPRLADGSAPPITVHQLLTHTAGLSYGFMQPADGPYRTLGVSDGFDVSGLAFEEQLGRIVAAGLSYSPGTAWGYSVGLDVLGRAIERVSDAGLPDVVAELVTRPLGMSHTGFRPAAGVELATPYADDTPPVRMREGQRVPFFDLSGLLFSPSAILDPNTYPSAGAGMSGTAREFVRSLEAVRSGGGGLLKHETTRAMLTNQTGDSPVALGPGWGFGYGGAILTDPVAAATPQPKGTWSWGGVWGHNWFVDPTHGLVVAFLTNTAVEGMMGASTIAVRDAVYASL